MFESNHNAIFEKIADALRNQGFIVLPNGLPPVVVAELQRELALYQDEQFLPAGVGRGLNQQQAPLIRRDKIAWIEPGLSFKAWADWTFNLQSYLNQHLFLGLFSFESHFAVYAPGDFYHTHLDAFHGQSSRVLSLVTYLNADWQLGDGGELVIYDAKTSTELVRVLPTIGTLVLFLSEEFPHEVKPSSRNRYSVAGWFRVNSSTSNRIDPQQ